MFRDMKTSAAGLAMILTGATGFLHLLNSDIPGPDLGTSFTSVIAGIGLLFAKDSKPAPVVK